MRTLVGGVGYRWQRDGSLGLLATDALAGEHLPAGVEVQDLGYGALLVAMDLQQSSYDRLVLVTASQRGRAPGTIERRTWTPALTDPAEVQERVREAGAGVIDIEHLLVVGQHLGALPADVVVIDAEPHEVSGSVEPSPAGAGSLARLIEAVRAELA